MSDASPERWPGAEPESPKQRFSGNAVRAFLWATIGSLAMPVPLVAPIMALRFARDAEFDVRHGVPRMRGAGLVLAAKILATIEIVLFAVFLVFLVWLFVKRVIEPPGG